MTYDPIGGEERVSSFFLKRFLLLSGAIWGGSWVGGIGLGIGLLTDAGWPGSSGIPVTLLAVAALIGAITAPVLLVSEAGIPNLLLLLCALVYFMRSEGISFTAWTILAGIESLVAMLGWVGGYRTGWPPVAAAWAGWLVCLSMLVSGAWLVRQRQIHRWARHLALVNAENASRRAEREARQRDGKSH